MTDAERYDALLDAGREPARECSLCGRETALKGFGPCSEACEGECRLRAARLAEAEWVDKWIGDLDDRADYGDDEEVA